MNQWTISVEQVCALVSYRPVLERLSQVLPGDGSIDAAHARALGCTFDDFLWFSFELAVNNCGLRKKLTAFLNDNAKRVLHIFEEAAPDDDRVRTCIQATDDWLTGSVTSENLCAAALAASEAASDVKQSQPHYAAFTAWGAAHAASGAAQAAREAVKSDEFGQWQFDRLIYWLTEDDPVALPMPETPHD